MKTKKWKGWALLTKRGGLVHVFTGRKPMVFGGRNALVRVTIAAERGEKKK